MGNRMGSAVLPRYNVLDVKGEIGIELLLNSAIFTAIVRALANESLRLLIHYGLEPHARARALRRKRATKSMYSTYLSYSPRSAGESDP